jgi:hypothetical protein
VEHAGALDEIQELGIGAERNGLQVGVLEHDEGGKRLSFVGDDDRAAPGCLPHGGFVRQLRVDRRENGGSLPGRQGAQVVEGGGSAGGTGRRPPASGGRWRRRRSETPVAFAAGGR